MTRSSPPRWRRRSIATAPTSSPPAWSMVSRKAASSSWRKAKCWQRPSTCRASASTRFAMPATACTRSSKWTKPGCRTAARSRKLPPSPGRTGFPRRSPSLSSAASRGRLSRSPIHSRRAISLPRRLILIHCHRWKATRRPTPSSTSWSCTPLRLARARAASPR